MSGNLQINSQDRILLSKQQRHKPIIGTYKLSYLIVFVQVSYYLYFNMYNSVSHKNLPDTPPTESQNVDL